MDAVSLAGVSWVAQRGVRLLLFVAEKQEWCFLVCSSGSPSFPSGLEQPLVQAVRGCRALSAYGSFWKNSSSPLSRCKRCSHMEIWTLRPSPSFLSVLLVFGCCLWSTSYFRDPCAAWSNSEDMFYGRLWTNFSIFYVAVNSISEVSSLRSHAEQRSVLSRCFSSQSLVCDVRTWKFEIASTRFRGWQW